MTYVGEGLRGSNGARSILHRISATPSATHNQTGPLWCWFPSGWACAHSRPLWVSSMNSPVRLGVSPAGDSTLTGVFNQRFEVLFPCAGALGLHGLFHSPFFLPVYLCMNVGPQGRPVTTSQDLPAAPCRPAAALPALLHNPPPCWVRQLLPCCESSLPGCQSPPLLLVWVSISALSPWLLDFHTV